MGKTHLTRSERLADFIGHGDGKQTRQIKYLNDMHQQVIALRKMGHKNIEIARMLNISPRWVTAIRHSWVGEQEADRLDAIRDDVVLDFAAKMQRGRDLAIDFLLDSLDITTDAGARLANLPTLKVKVSTDMLDRAPEAAKVTRVQSAKIVTHATLDDLIRFKERAKEVKKAAEAALAKQIEQTETIDVTPKEVQDAAT